MENGKKSTVRLGRSGPHDFNPQLSAAGRMFTRGGGIQKGFQGERGVHRWDDGEIRADKIDFLIRKRSRFDKDCYR